MRARRWAVVGGAVALLLTGVARSQPTDEDVERAAREYEAWIEAMSEQIADVRFDEGDVESFILYWEEFSELADETEAEEGHEEQSWEEIKDLGWILEDPAYRSWAAERGLEGEAWLKKSFRIMVMSMRGFMQEQYSDGHQQVAEQAAMIEEQCRQVGPDLCQQMKQAMAASVAMMQVAQESWKKIPEPSAEESALLEKYDGQLMALMENDEEPEEDW